MRAARRLSQGFMRTHPADAALVLEQLPTEVVVALIENLPPSTAATGLQGMSSMAGATCLERISARQAGAILGELPPDFAAVLLLRLGGEELERLLVETPPEAAELLRGRLRYRPSTAGALMDSRVLSFRDRLTAGEALSRLRRSSRSSHGHAYVVDSEERLVGVLTLRELLLAPPKSQLAAVMNTRVARLSAENDRSTILAHSGWHQFHALPVVDDAGHFLGVLGHRAADQLRLEEPPPRNAGASASISLALLDLCWIGMTKILSGVATAVFPAPADPESRGRSGC